MHGLAYLHSRNPPVIHGDLHPVSFDFLTGFCCLNSPLCFGLSIKGNIMIDNEGNAVLIDFGQSRLRFEMTRSLSDLREAGVVRYLAPELIMGDDKFRTSEMSDVYSLGMVIYHFLYESDPFYYLRNDHAVIFAVASGNTPRREPLPARRSSSAWRIVDEKLWSLLELAWAKEAHRISLSGLHETVRRTCF